MLATRDVNQKTLFTKFLKLTLMVVIAGVSVWGLFNLLTRKPVNSSLASESISSTSTAVQGPVATFGIDRVFTYPLTQAAEGPNLFMSVISAEKRKEIIVKGSKATAIDGRAFLIINLKFKNDANNGVEVDSRDYFRLSANGNTDEWMAPDIHNDPVEVQAISTKTTRLGFPINEADTNLVLQVGELNGTKEQITLNF